MPSPMDFDALLERCGNFGRFQFIILLCFGATNILSSMHYYTQTMITFTPEHWCYHEKLANSSFDEIRAIYAQTESPHCTLLDDVVDGKPIVAEVGQCQQWIYEYEMGYRTITTDLNWVCDNSFQSAVGQSLYFMGSVIGTVFFGFLADKVGRLPAMICTTLTGALGDFLTSFVNSLAAFAFFRFIAGLSTDTLFYLMYIMVFEYLSPKKRTLGLNMITGLFYFTGLVFTPWFALWTGSWRPYLYIASAPALIAFAFPFLICESAQWLLTKQRYDRAVKCMKHVAKINKREVKDEVFDEFVAYYQKKESDERKLKTTKDTFWGMFRTPRLRKITIIMVLKYMIISLAIDVISRNMEGMGTSPFILFSATSVVYIFGGLSIILLQNRIGRKGMAFSTLLLSAVIIATTGFLIAMLDAEQHPTILAIMVGFGRYGVVVSYEAEAQYASEFIPTSVRGRAMANIHVAGFGFSILCNYVIYLGYFYKPLPYICISILLVVGAMLCVALPETMNQKLPQTLKDGEEFARHQRWYHFPCFDRRKESTDAEASN